MRYLLLLILCLSGISVGAQGSDLFSALLKESAMQWHKPTGFEEVGIKNNEFLPYEKGLLSDDGALEIRYALRPLKRLSIDYDDPHGAMPDPNHIFSRMFQALTANMSLGGRTPSQEYKTEHAKKLFGADWAAMSIFDVDPEYAKEYKGGMLLAMHKNQVADAYVVFLFKDYQKAKAVINANLATLTFSRNETQPEKEGDK